MPFLLSLLMSASVSSAEASAPEILFSKAHAELITGLSEELNPQKIRDDAAAYAFFRRYPKSTRGMDIWQSCYESHETYFFCDMILLEREKTGEAGTDKDKRKKFFDALMTLDAESTRGKNCPAARRVLLTLANDESASSLHARANYWLWVCAGLMQDKDESARISDILFKKFPLAHHTLLVMQRENSPRLEEIFSGQSAGQFPVQNDWPVQFRSSSVPEINPYIAGIEALMEQKEDGASAVLGLYINPKLIDAEPGLRLYMASLMSRVSASVPSVLPVARVLVSLFQSRPEFISAPLLKLLFPDDYAMSGADPKKKFIFRQLIDEHKLGVDGPLLAGLIHQESALNPRAASASGAYGLSQMLIGTANDQWRKLSGNDTATVTAAMLQDPSFSVKLGAADLQRRLQTFEGNLVLAVASYNAGETAVKNWLKEVKAIRDPQILADVLFMNRAAAETHVPQYVAAVLSKSYWYTRLYPALDVKP